MLSKIFDVQNNDKDPWLKIGDQIGISKYKKRVCKGLHSKLIWINFVIKKVKHTVPWTIIRMFYENELQNIERKTVNLIKKKPDNFYAKWSIMINCLTVCLIGKI